jgi:hypothetical protein
MTFKAIGGFDTSQIPIIIDKNPDVITGKEFDNGKV